MVKQSNGEKKSHLKSLKSKYYEQKLASKGTSKPNSESLVKFLCDYLPLIFFFCFYKFYPAENKVVPATIAMVASSFFALIISYLVAKKIPKVTLFSSIILLIFGGLTILFENDLFIKIKPTIINLIFSLILFYSYVAGKPLLYHLFGGKLEISNQAWSIFTRRWALFFLFLALLNEIIWRNCSTDFWVQFKVFGMMPISLIFTIIQFPFISKEVKNFRSSSS